MAGVWMDCSHPSQNSSQYTTEQSSYPHYLSKVFTRNWLTCCIPIFHQVSAEGAVDINTLVKTVFEKLAVSMVAGACRICNAGGITSSSPEHIVVHQFAPLLAHTAAVHDEIT